MARADGSPEMTGVTIVERARGGDVDAFETLVRTRIDRLHRIACAILGSESDARDATQDAFLAAWRQLPGLRDPARFDAWLTRILVNACRMHLRARGRVREVSSDLLPEPGGAGPGAAFASGRSFADGIAAADALEHAFERLSADQRAILVLYHLEDRSVREIASVLARPVGTVKWRLHGARAALARALKEQDHD